MGSHKLHRLTALSVKKINTPGKYGDGHGLYLIVDSSGAKRWEQRLTVQGRRRDIGLGSISLVSLEEAREIALKNKRLARDGGDPIAEKRVVEGQNISFKDVAMSVHQLNAPSYRIAKYMQRRFVLYRLSAINLLQVLLRALHRTRHAYLYLPVCLECVGAAG